MVSKKLLLSALGGLIVSTSTFSFADQTTVSGEKMVAKQTLELLGTGHSFTTMPAEQLIVRRKAPVPGGSGCDDARDLIEHPECTPGNTLIDKELFAREASEGPRGGDNERPGDRQRRGGRLNNIEFGEFTLAREASEGPRGGDNERPGDRQRRGGRNA